MQKNLRMASTKPKLKLASQKQKDVLLKINQTDIFTLINHTLEQYISNSCQSEKKKTLKENKRKQFRGI